MQEGLVAYARVPLQRQELNACWPTIDNAYDVRSYGAAKKTHAASKQFLTCGARLLLFLSGLGLLGK